MQIFLLPVVGQLKGNLDVGIRTYFLLLDELFPIVAEFVDIDVQILHQPERIRIKPGLSWVCLCIYFITGARVKPDLCSLSAAEERSLWISGVHFQRSLRGAGNSLTLAALISLDGLPILFSHGHAMSLWLNVLSIYQYISHTLWSSKTRFLHVFE